MLEHDLMTWPEIGSPASGIPERSRLYQIQPLGANAGQLEGLLSYLVRVARAHSVNPRHLLRSVVAYKNPALNKLCSVAFFTRHSATVNGLGKYAELFVGEVAKLTKADFLRPMCLLPLQDLLPHNGAGLLTPRPKWCPACIADMAKSGDDAYRPLAWSFELYRVCTHHNVRLRDICTRCGKAQPFIPRYPDFGRCDHCGGLLSYGHAKSKAALDIWVSNAIADLVRHLRELDSRATAQQFAAITREAVAQLAEDNRARFCELLGLPRWAVTRWLYAGEKPSLPQLLSICYGLNVMPSTLLLRNPSMSITFMSSDLRTIPTKLKERRHRPCLNTKERQHVVAKLQKISRNADDTRSLTEVANELGFTRSCLKYWFTDECSAVTIKHSTAAKSQTAARMHAEKAAVSVAVHAISARGEYASRRKVNAILRTHKVSLGRSDLLRVYRETALAVCRTGHHHRGTI